MLCYRFLLQKHCSFKAQRLALMLILLAVFVLPFIQMHDWGDWLPNLSIHAIELTKWEDLSSTAWSTEKLPVVHQSLTWADFWLFLSWGYCLGLMMVGGRFCIQILSVLRTLFSAEIRLKNGYKYVLVERPRVAAAFMGYIFISKDIWQSDDYLLIAQHEEVHVRQWHSIDRVLTEVLYVFQWFNPFIYWFRRDLTELHEYLADQGVVKSGVDPIFYQQLIMKYATNSKLASFGNQFNHSLTLKRITMIAHYNQLENKSFYRIFLLIPIFIALNCLVGFQSKTTTSTNGAFILPIKTGDFKSLVGYGMRMHPIYKVKKLHTGVDFIAAEGTVVLAVKDGKVTRLEEKETGYGKNIVLTIDDEYSVLYAHLASFSVKIGDVVKQGMPIGLVGNTGATTNAHLHFEMIKNGKKINPVGLLPKF